MEGRKLGRPRKVQPEESAVHLDEGGQEEEPTNSYGAGLLGFPEVPADDRPKALYVSEIIPPNVRKVLIERGWNIVDIRLLSSKTDGERADAVRATLEGARMGSLSLNPQQQKQLELEARACGLVGNKEAQIETILESTEKAILTDLLNFGSGTVAPTSPVGKLLGSRNSKKDVLRGFALKQKAHALRMQGKHEAAKILEENGGHLQSIKHLV